MEAEHERACRSFVVELLIDGDLRLVVAQIHPEGTLRQTVGAALAELSDDAADDPESQLARGERLEIPCPMVDVRTSQQASRQQHVQLSIADGVISSAGLSGICYPPRDLICQEAYALLMMPRTSDELTLVLWVENSELLELAPPRRGSA